MRLAVRHGFTLLELVIAAFIFAVGVLALEATAATSLRRMRRSAALGLAASVAGSRLELSAAMRCADLASGSDTVRAVVSSWSVAETALTSVRRIEQSVTYDIDGAMRTDSYRSFVRCSE